jgi:uncharacterized protein YecE (DUF72 family)
LWCLLRRGWLTWRQAGRAALSAAAEREKGCGAFDAFLGDLPPGARAAFEFRHASWFDDEVFERLRRRNLALCIADSEKMSTPVEITANYAYFRLRDEGYTADDIARWADTIAREAAHCQDVFVYFKHEEEGKGPEFARLLSEHLGIAADRS